MPSLKLSCALLFLISFAALSFEVALTRICGLLLYQDYAFLAISFAMLGIGLGAIVSPAVLKDERIPLSKVLVLFGLSFPIVFFVLVALPATEPDTLWAFFGLCSLPPFILQGILAVCFYRMHPQESALLYGSDILGAATGALAAVAGMNLLDPYFYSLAISVAVLLCAAFLGWRQHKPAAKPVVIPVSLAVLVAVVCSLPPIIHARDKAIFSRRVPGKVLFEELPQGQATIERTVWNSVSRVDLTTTPYNYKFLFSDGAVPAVMFKMDRGLESVAMLRHTVGFAPFTYGTNKKVLSIGSGGGHDCLLSKLGGADAITAVEVNGAMINMVQSERHYNGGVFEMDGVKLVVDEGRSYLRSTQEKYDDILLLLTQGNNAEAGGRVTLENYLMTEEAYAEFYDHLNPGGKFVIATHDGHRAARHVMTWAAMLKKKGIELPEAIERLAVLSNPDVAYRIVLIFHRDIPASQDMQKLYAFTESTDADAAFLPAIWEKDPAFSGMAKGTVSAAKFIESAPQGVTFEPLTDNKPFHSDAYRGLNSSHRHLIFWTTAVLGATATIPLSRRRFKTNRIPLSLGILYFALLGSAFMIVEIVLMRKMMLYLGYPTMSLAVVLFAILLSAGGGSLFAQRFFRGNFQNIPAFLLLLLGGLLLIYLPLLVVTMNAVMDQPLVVRAVAAAGILAVPGFLMGMPFPTGLAMTEKHLQDSISWMWAINGISGILGSIISVALAVIFGLNMTIAVGGALYVAAALVLFLYQKNLTPTR